MSAPVIGNWLGIMHRLSSRAWDTWFLQPPVVTSHFIYPQLCKYNDDSKDINENYIINVSCHMILSQGQGPASIENMIIKVVGPSHA